MQRLILVNWLIPLALVSILYLASFAVTFGVFMPVQQQILPDLLHSSSILFLPHGVRVLTAWLYGWRAVLFLAPGGLVSHTHLFGFAGLCGWPFFAAIVGLVCASLSFWLLARLGMDFRFGRTGLASWREILLAGSVASIINVVGSFLFFGLEVRSASVYFLGDLAGLLTAMLVLLLAFRWYRKAR